MLTPERPDCHLGWITGGPEQASLQFVAATIGSVSITLPIHRPHMPPRADRSALEKLPGALRLGMPVRNTRAPYRPPCPASVSKQAGVSDQPRRRRGPST